MMKTKSHVVSGATWDEVADKYAKWLEEIQEQKEGRQSCAFHSSFPTFHVEQATPLSSPKGKKLLLITYFAMD